MRIIVSSFTLLGLLSPALAGRGPSALNPAKPIQVMARPIKGVAGQAVGRMSTGLSALKPAKLVKSMAWARAQVLEQVESKVALRLTPDHRGASPVSSQRPNQAVPPLAMRSLANGDRTYGRVSWHPRDRSFYDRIPEAGRQLLASYYDRLNTLSQMRMRPGRAFVIMPAHNEAAGIYKTLGRLLDGAARDDKVEGVAVVDNASTDGTADEVRRFASQHPDQVELVDHTKGTDLYTRPARDKLVIHLMAEKTPGKINALLKPAELFAAKGSIPEYIAHIDADTFTNAGAVSKTIELMKQRKQVAATGGSRYVGPDGRELLPYPIRRLASHHFMETQVVDGAFGVWQSPHFLAAYGSIRGLPFLTEDLVTTALPRAAGFSTGSKREGTQIPVYKLAPMTKEQAASQQARWRAGGYQLEDYFGAAAMSDMGMRPDLQTELRRVVGKAIGDTVGAARHPIASTRSSLQQNLEVAREVTSEAFTAARHPIGTVKDTIKTARWALEMKGAPQAAARRARPMADEANRTGDGSWTPPR